MHRRRVREQHNRTGTDEGKWTRRILDSFGAAATDEGPDERHLASSTPLPITRRRTKLGSSISQEKIVSDPREVIDRGIYKPAGALAWMLVSRESNELREPGLVDGEGDELAAEDDVGEQDGEVAAGLGVPALLVQHVPRDGHQVRPVRVRRVVHLAAAAAALARPPSLFVRLAG